MAAAMIGVGEAVLDDRVMPAAEALAAVGLEPLALQPKEGLALLNGTQFSTAHALVGLFEAETAAPLGARDRRAVARRRARLGRAFRPAHPCAAPSSRPARGAEALRALVAGSEIRASHRFGDPRVQDPYCLRCQPQVMGAALDLLRQAAATLADEANAVSDNPLVFAEDDEALSGGNFHGQPVAFAADMIALALCEIGSLAERRIALLVDPALSGLPAFLTANPGLNSGFMLAQVTAAALVSENKQRAYPASVDSIPTSANQEDHVSMAAHAARRLLPMAENVYSIVGDRVARRRAGLRLSRADALERAARGVTHATARRDPASRRRPLLSPGHPRGVAPRARRRDHRGGRRGAPAGSGGCVMSDGRPDWLEVRRGEAPLIVSIPHGGFELMEYEPRFVSPWLACKDADWRLYELYDFLESFGATRIRTRLSRSIVDVNRDPSGASLYPGQATTELCPTTTFDGEPLYSRAVPDAIEIDERRRAYFDPYHDALRGEIARLRARYARVALFDAHSIRSRIPRLFDGELPVFNLGTNGGASCSPQLREALGAVLAASGQSFVVDGRFRGGWIIRHYGKPEEGIQAIQLELACRGYMLEPGVPSPADWPQPIDEGRAVRTRVTLRRVLETILYFLCK